MSFSIETPTTDVQAVNQAFFDLLERGMDKQAAESGNRLIRTVVRQEANVRSLYNVTPVGPGDLDQHPTSDQPMKYLDIEPNSEASAVQFYATPEAESYTLSRVPGFFQMIQSKEFYKNKFELMTNRNDVRQILAENSTKDVGDQEDVAWRRGALIHIKRNPTVQRSTFASLTPTAWKSAMQAVVDRRQPVGKGLLAESRYMDMIDQPATVVGESIARRHYEEGIKNEKGLLGLPVVTSVKTDIYLKDEAWIVPPEEFMGAFWTLQDATLFVEQRGPMIRFYVYESICIVFARGNALQQIYFNGQPNGGLV